ncbi:MAG: hypothetical protein AAF039_07900 [Bacteroidota bacterium]
MKKIPADRILGVSAMIISILTLAIFIYQTDIMRLQSKLSVKPRLDFTTNFDQKDSTIIIQEVIENKGLGPAIIDSIYFKFKGETHPVDVEIFLEKNLPKLLEYGYLPQHASLTKGTTLSQNEEKAIFTYRIPMGLMDSLYIYLGVEDEDENPFPIEVIYTSIYEDEKWMMDNDKMSQPIKLD